MKREYIFILRCDDFEEAERQRKETDRLLSRRLIAKRKQCCFTTQCCFDPCELINRIRVEIEGLDSIDDIKSLEMESLKLDS